MIGAGIAKPFGDFGDSVQTGYVLTPRVGCYATPRLALGGEVAYYRYTATGLTLRFPPGLQVEPINAQVFQATGYVKYLLTGNALAPYVRAQLGLYRRLAESLVEDVALLASENDFGLGGGAGVQYVDDRNIGGFIDVIYHKVLARHEGIEFLGIQAGLVFFIGTDR